MRPTENGEHQTRGREEPREQRRPRRRPGAGRTAGSDADRSSRIPCSWSPTSRAVCQRSSGSLARQVRTTRSSAGGLIGESVEIAAGSSFMIDEMSDAWDEPENAFFPVAISYSREPRAKMSVRASLALPSSCSGAMYCTVPRIEPSCVRFGGAVGIAVSAAAESGAAAKLRRGRSRGASPRPASA